MGAGADFFTANFLTGAAVFGALAGVFFVAVFAGAFFAATFFRVVFLATDDCVFAAAFFAAHLFLRAFTMLALPVALRFRFGLAGSGEAGAGTSDSPRVFDHRSCWASFMCRRAAAENFLRLVGSEIGRAHV